MQQRNQISIFSCLEGVLWVQNFLMRFGGSRIKVLQSKTFFKKRKYLKRPCDGSNVEKSVRLRRRIQASFFKDL